MDAWLVIITTQKSKFQFRPQFRSNLTGFSLPPSTHFILANEEAISFSQTQKHSHRGLACSGIEGLCSLPKFNVVKNKPNSCNNSFNQTDIPGTEPPWLFSNLVFPSVQVSLSQVALPCAEINKNQRTPSKQHKTQNHLEILVLLPPGLVCHQPGRCWHWMRKKSYGRVGSI